MDVRRLRPEDFKLGVEAIRRLKTPDGYPAPEETYIQRFLSRPGNVLIVAFDGDTPVGFVLAYLLDRIDRDQRMVLFVCVRQTPFHQRVIGGYSFERRSWERDYLPPRDQ